ncbi:MAG: PIG-L family deacetylase [Bryobacteraceae bacterium]
MSAKPISTRKRAQLATWPADIKVVLDNVSYTPGSSVKFRLIAGEAYSTASDAPGSLEVSVTVFPTGGTEPISTRRIVVRNTSLASSEYQIAWRVPDDVPTGRYSAVFEAHDPESGVLIWKSLGASFAVWRSEISVEDFDTHRRFYSPGDPVSFTLTLVNRTEKTWSDLRIEVGEAQYPWISAPRESHPNRSFAYPEPVSLAPGKSRALTLAGATSHDATATSIQYTVTVRAIHPKMIRGHRSKTSKTVAFRTTPPVFLRLPGPSGCPVYPAAYMHSDLSQVQMEGYRAFYGRENKSISFDQNRTSFAAGKRATVRVQVSSRQSSHPALLELRNANGELVDQAEARREGVYLSAALRFGSPGLYSVVAQVTTRNGRLRAAGRLEVAANILPRSLAVICAHPDDEFLHPAVIRAAVENSIPVHLIFLTNGDAGGGDRFFGPAYTPSEAIEFGHIRMAEARAAARHLGVPETNLHFLGLPDGFLETIRTDEDSTPIFSPLLGTENSPYCGLHQPNLPFEKRSIVNTLAGLLGKIDPDTVYMSHPDERHADHRAAALLAIDALRALVAVGRLTSPPTIRADQFYGASADAPAPFSYRRHEFFSSGEAMARVQEAYWYYQTQGGNHARGHILSYADLPRIEHHQEILNWASDPIHADFDLRATA